jgi:hypothetical protein
MKQGIQTRSALSAALIMLGGVLIAVAAGLMVLLTTGVIGDESGGSGPGTVTGFGSVLSVATPGTKAQPAAALTTAPRV